MEVIIHTTCEQTVREQWTAKAPASWSDEQIIGAFFDAGLRDRALDRIQVVDENGRAVIRVERVSAAADAG